MSAQIRPNRLTISDRFPMLGFTIRTDGTPQRAEVTIATEPALFTDPSRRTRSNFFSTSELGALSIPKGEAVYVVPPEVLARFIGADRLYFGLATAPATNGADYKVVVKPAEDSPYVSISALTGRSLRRVRMFPSRSRRMAGNGGYGAGEGPKLRWAGDTPAPGMEQTGETGARGNATVRTGGGNGTDTLRTRTGNGAVAGNGAVDAGGGGTASVNGGGTNAAPEAIDYDDGFGPMPPVPEAGRSAPPAAPAATRALGLDTIRIAELQRMQPPVVSTVGPAAASEMQAALNANPALSNLIAGARAAAEVAEVSIGIGPKSGVALPAAGSLGRGIILTSGDRLGVYGAPEIGVSDIASLDAGAQVTVVRGDIENFRNIAFAAGLDAGDAGVRSGAVLLDAQQAFIGVTVPGAPGTSFSPLEIFTRVQRQLAAELGPAAAFGNAPAPAYAMIIGPEDVQKAERYAPAWRDLFTWTVPSTVAREVSRRGMSIQRIQDAAGTLNLDKYEVHCTRLPSGYTAESLLDHVRRNMNSFVDTRNTEFNPYSSTDRTKWNGSSPVGAIFNLDIIGPDNAAVVGSMVEPERFRFTTIETPDTGSHPVSGHREFGVRTEDGIHVFYTRGADRSTHGIGESLVFAGADHLWKSFQRKLKNFIKSNGGAATAPTRFSERFHPDVVRILYGGASAQSLARGLGAGHDPYAVEVKYRAFIPSPVINGPPLGDDFGGDGRGFSYDQGTSRGEITSVVHLSSGMGIERVELKNRRWGESTAYDSDDTFHVSGKPDWWRDMRSGARPKERVTLQAKDENLRIYSGIPSHRGPRVFTEKASAVTINLEGALPLAPLAPDIDADISVLFRNRNGLIQAKALGRHDGFPAHELYVNGEPLYRYDPVAAGNGPTSLLGSGDIEVDTPWVTVARTYTVRTGTQAQPMTAGAGRALEIDESFTLNWDEVDSIPQPTDVSCWAAAAAMVIGWRDRMSLTPKTIAEISGRTTATGLDPAEIEKFAYDLGLEFEHPQSYTPEGFRQLLENKGPLWVTAAVPSLHAIVVTGFYNDGPQLYVRITDPWDRAVGTPGAPGNYANTHSTGSRYIMKWEDFVAEYEAAATDYSSVNLQILHSGTTAGRQPNRGATTPPGYAQALAESGQAGAFPPPGVEVIRSQTEQNGVLYDLFTIEGTVHPQMPPQVAQDLIPGEKIVIADWPYIDGPGGRAQGGVAIDWSHGAGSVADVRVSPSGGQVSDGWRVKVHADIGPGPSAPSEAKLKVTVRTTFSRDGEADQSGVTDIILAGSGQFETVHRQEAQAQPIAA